MTVISPVEPGTTGPAGVERLRRSPLADRAAELAAAAGPRGTRLAEEPFLTQVNLRAAPEQLARLGNAAGIPLPRKANRVGGDVQRAALWLGPDEWLLMAPDGEAASLRDALGSAGAASVVDLSANRTTLRLSGGSARDVLEKVCSLDLHPRAFAAGHCAQTLLGRTQAVLWQLGPEPDYRILVRNSFAGYLADLLLDALRGPA
ncbi:MAG: sarcosine oxidase subunit gamma [Saccharopolyspora sp.]|uniref:sarcosine oxidase subunit gamma n=1 Tax=Saccharopolyspora sp. TaxID=33915 RepID=UPI0026006774|nr:sarcosine oxidase subunit gamma family protein [Saccharopolyspora sp.]MBQ6640974.1 sarcosine oxidase subunit gamma [Saccharopolyspora sp.]